MLRITALAALGILCAAATLALAQDEAKKKPQPGQGLPDINQLFERLDKNKDGFLDKDEVPERLKENFDQLDTNKDGKLSKEELQKLRDRFPGRRPDMPPNTPSGQNVPEPLFRLIDANGDGKLTKEEFQAAFEKLRRLDKNGDGAIDRDELQAAFRTDPPMRPGTPGDSAASVARMLERMDTNKDGKLSKDEVRGPLADAFERFDENKDGFLDKSELEKAARMRPPGDPLRKPEGGFRPGGDLPGRPGRPTLSFDDLDKNADGRLTKDEVKGTPLFDKFDELDKNKDGKLDPKEFEAAQGKK